MKGTRKNTRNLCADLLKVRWKDPSGTQNGEFAVLEDISPDGACLKLERAIAQDTEVRILYPRGQYRGTVRYCVADISGFLIGVKFAPGIRWSRSQYDPAHLIRL
jgi:hypothetical protein